MPRAAPEYRYLGTGFRALLWASPRRIVKVKVQGGEQRTILTDATFERREGDAWVPVVLSKLWRNDNTRCGMRLWLFGRHVYLHRAVYWLVHTRGTLDSAAYTRIAATYGLDGREEFSKFSHMWTPF